MSTSVVAVKNRIVASLRDVNADSWPEDTVYETILEAERVITNYRPDATATDAEIVCVAGIRQTIAGLTPPPNRLLKVKYNVSAQGAPGRSVRRVAEGDLDAIRPDWRSAANADQAREFMHDDREPLLFYTNPPVQAGTRLRVSYSAIPQSYGTVVSSTQTTVSELYEPMLVEFALYRLFGHDVEGSVNISRSQQHLQNFQSMMGVKIEAEGYFGPKNLEHKR